MKTIGATLFATLFVMFAVSMPVYAQHINYIYPNTEWRIAASVDEMTDEVKSATIQTGWENYLHQFILSIKCDGIIKISSWQKISWGKPSRFSWDEIRDKIFFDERYESDTENLLVRFDKNDAFHIRAGKEHYHFAIMRLTDIDFFSKLKEHKVLRIRFHMKEEYYSIVAKFNITGFNVAYESFRSRFCN